MTITCGHDTYTSICHSARIVEETPFDRCHNLSRRPKTVDRDASRDCSNATGRRFVGWPCKRFRNAHEPEEFGSGRFHQSDAKKFATPSPRRSADGCGRSFTGVAIQPNTLGPVVGEL